MSNQETATMGQATAEVGGPHGELGSEHDDQQDAEGRRRPLWRRPPVLAAAVLAAAMLAAAALAVLPLSGDQGDDAGPADTGDEGGEELIDTFTGTEDATTGAFTVEGQWELRWESEGDELEVSLLDQDGEAVQPVIEHEGSGGGSTYPPQDGTYSLEVVADGDWSIRVFDVTD